jgi:hypothetical protein
MTRERRRASEIARLRVMRTFRKMRRGPAASHLPRRVAAAAWIVLGKRAMSPGEPADSWIGRTLDGRYELVERLGADATGAFFRGRHLGLDTPVTVKLLEAALPERGSAERFETEALLLGRLAHPNVVAIMDYGRTDDGSLYQVLEHVRGRPVRELVREEGPQAVDVVRALSEQLFAALVAMHDAGIAHGDISSENVIVDLAIHGGVRLKLVAFGSSFAIDRAEAPRGGARGGIASDLRSAASVIGELLTGEPQAEAIEVGREPRLERPAIDRLRDGIGGALRLGDVDHLVDLYLALAALLLGGGEPAAALAELTEAVDMVTSGQGAESAGGPLELWRLLLAAAELHDEAGSDRAAWVFAGHAHRHARRVGSARGASAAQRFLQGLHDARHGRIVAKP